MESAFLWEPSVYLLLLLFIVSFTLYSEKHLKTKHSRIFVILFSVIVGLMFSTNPYTITASKYDNASNTTGINCKWDAGEQVRSNNGKLHDVYKLAIDKFEKIYDYSLKWSIALAGFGIIFFSSIASTKTHSKYWFEKIVGCVLLINSCFVVTQVSEFK